MLTAIVIILCVCLLIKLTCGITKSPVCLNGRTAIITGANSGIGYQVALNLASRGCRLILADKDDLETSRKRIVDATKNHQIIIKNVDFTSFQSVRNFAADILSTEDKLDILINNAGIAAASQSTTEDGLETVMQVNLYSHFLLTYLLCGLLKNSAPSRIVFTASSLAYFGQIRDLELKRSPNGIVRKFLIYCNSKLATIMIADCFAEKLKAIHVSSNSVHPGWVRTQIFRNFGNNTNWGLLSPMIYIILHFTGKSVWEGAQTTTRVAISQSLDNTTGRFFYDCVDFPKPLQAKNRKLSKELWDLCEKLVNLRPEEKECFEKIIQ